MVDSMTPQERERMNLLCQQIQEEKNPLAFDNLVQQLLELFDEKQTRIKPTDSASTR